MREWMRNNSLSIALFGLFAVSFAGQAFAGWRAHIADLAMHGGAPMPFLAYLRTGHFVSATFENWESEFLQMAVYVLLTALLIQKGSPESRKPEGDNPEDADPAARRWDPKAPWPVHRGGLLLALYSRSLSIALVALFVASFVLHLAGSTQRSNEEGLLHGQPPKTMTETLTEPEFWYESFQNWQSEFLSMGVLVVLGIYLRQRGSPESKPVAAPHEETSP